MGIVVAVTGGRDLGPGDADIIEKEMAEVVARRPDEIVFGGARGADTIALVAAALSRKGPIPSLTVIVPNRVVDQPMEAQEAIYRHADEVVELSIGRFDSAAYRRRNEEMVARADELVAFWSGCAGGTSMTIEIAARLSVRTRVVRIAGA